MSEHRKRQYFRIRYPIDDRPSFEQGAGTWEVLDVAEYGIGFLTRAGDDFQMGQQLKGRLRIGTRHVLDVEGAVVWVASTQAAIRFDRPIPFKVVLDEQLHLKNKYKLRDLMQSEREEPRKPS